MTDTCIFCKIINKDIPADIVFEDDLVVAFLDIKPVSRGHVLVVPKKHTADVLSATDDVLIDLMPKVKKIAQALVKTVGADGINISANNGAASGQIIFHLHFHLIPRFNNDHLPPWPHADSETKTRKDLAEKIKENL
jgi:histidine triad (HIT) family protein